ncbi:uncharacterized protein LOC130529992 isoform X1 [Takifugu flavidus]|uniref:Ig-like domain-containing protein n=1 Tax=Takifugu flavidus TaxID=433684 RepID=A0A5C6MRV8_9TELE|nr:uncharacterized protein LOC130529992 isoform X1 [Takifugu flavidus]TWW57098.1 hypothetical protein D4764_08G0010850 [Takifugu flavidus]
MSLTLMKLLLLLHAAHSQEERTANCDEDVSLPCPGAAATQFSSVTWYKLHNGKKEGLIMMRQGRQQPLVYNSSPPVALGEEHSLKLFNVTPEDSGSYECAVNAKIGGRNLNIRVELLVNVCATQGTTVTPTTQSEQLLQDGAEELPLVWSLGGWGALGLIKILFSVITIQVFCAEFNRVAYGSETNRFLKASPAKMGKEENFEGSQSCLFFKTTERSTTGPPLSKRGLIVGKCPPVKVF